MADKRRISEEYAEIGSACIDKYDELDYLRDADINIIYLASTHRKKSKGKMVMGQCEKVADKNKWAIPADFTVTVFEPNCVDLSDDQLEILIFHELLHIMVDEDGNWSIRPHDLEDFKAIVNRYGTDWAE